MKTFLNSLDLPAIREDQNRELIYKITKKELDSVISRLKLNKSPGSDGYPGERYKTFKEELLPL